MESGKPPLTVVYAPGARDDLDEIWDWNAARHNADHARAYVDFLQDGIERLATDYEAGKPLDKRPELRRVTLRRSNRGHGHIVVYAVTPTQVNVLHIFHTAQDLDGRMGLADG